MAGAQDRSRESRPAKAEFGFRESCLRKPNSAFVNHAPRKPNSATPSRYGQRFADPGERTGGQRRGRRRIAIIRLDRPAKLNAFTHQMSEEIIAALDRTDADDAVRAVVLTGTGRAFCAGADLAAGGDTFVTETEGRPRPMSAGDRAASSGPRNR